jgi:hypothetical protein
VEIVGTNRIDIPRHVNSALGRIEPWCNGLGLCEITKNGLAFTTSVSSAVHNRTVSSMGRCHS